MTDINVASWNAGVATVWHDAPRLGELGDTITVEGVDPAGYNGSFLLSGCADTACTFALQADPGLYISGGTIE